MNTRRAMLSAGLLLLAVLLYTLWIYPSLPDLIPIHWNLRGEVDGWASKRTAVWLMPGIMVFILGLIPALPALSPANYKMEPFLPTFNYVMLVVAALMAYIHGIMLYAAISPKLDFTRGLMIGIYLSFALMGNVLGKTRRNFYMGIRTPWTLENEVVWIKTHRLGGQLFVASGLLGTLATVIGVPFLYTFAVVMVALLFPIPYSYIIYKRIEKGNP